MISRARTLAAALLALLAARGADAAIITAFNFNNTTNATTLLAPSQGSGTLSTNFVAANVTNFGGSTTNAQNGDPAGQALALQGGDSNVNNGRYLQYTGSTAGFSGLTVTFASQRTSTGFNSDQFQYSTDGGNSFTNFGAAYTPELSFANGAGLVTIDLSGLSAVNNAAGFAFRIVFSGATSAAGNNRIDNLVLNGNPTTGPAVPEPASVVLLGLGLAGVGVVARRRAR